MFCSGIHQALVRAVRVKIVVMLLDGDEPQANLREDALKVGAGFYVVTAKTAEIADYKALYPAALDVSHQAIELRPVEDRPRPLST